MSAKQQLLVQNFIHTYLEISPEAEATLTAYALETWRPRSPMSQDLLLLGEVAATGKSRAAAVMAAICRKAFVVSGRAAPAYLMKLLAEEGHPTLIVDDADNLMLDPTSEVFKKLRENSHLGFKILTSSHPFRRDVAMRARYITVTLTGTIIRNEIPRVLGKGFEQACTEIQQALHAEDTYE